MLVGEESPCICVLMLLGSSLRDRKAGGRGRAWPPPTTLSVPVPAASGVKAAVKGATIECPQRAGDRVPGDRVCQKGAELRGPGQDQGRRLAPALLFQRKAWLGQRQLADHCRATLRPCRCQRICRPRPLRRRQIRRPRQPRHAARRTALFGRSTRMLSGGSCGSTTSAPARPLHEGVAHRGRVCAQLQTGGVLRLAGRCGRQLRPLCGQR